MCMSRRRTCVKIVAFALKYVLSRLEANLGAFDRNLKPRRRANRSICPSHHWQDNPHQTPCCRQVCGAEMCQSLTGSETAFQGSAHAAACSHFTK